MSKVTAELIPSIQPYAALSADADKATIELLLAWIFALVLPLVMLPALDWQWIGQNLARQGSLRTVFLLLATGMLLIALVWYPEPPSPSRRLIGRTILSLFRSDSAFVWGAVVVMFVGLGVTSLGVAFKHIHSVIVAKLG